MIGLENLNKMSEARIDKIDRSELVEIADAHIDTSLPIHERVIRFMNQIKNPYCFLCGKTPVQISFTEGGKELDEAVFSYLQALKNK